MLTLTQKQAVLAYINATQAIATLPLTAASAIAIADYLNTQAAPDFTVWKTSVPFDEVMNNGMDWARVDNLSVGKARIWDWMSRLGSFNPSKANIRAGIDATWVGTAADLAVRAAVYVHCKRLANRIEQLFAVGTGSSADPAVMGFEGTITADEVREIREM